MLAAHGPAQSLVMSVGHDPAQSTPAMLAAHGPAQSPVTLAARDPAQSTPAMLAAHGPAQSPVTLAARDPVQSIPVMSSGRDPVQSTPVMSSGRDPVQSTPVVLEARDPSHSPVVFATRGLPRSTEAWPQSHQMFCDSNVRDGTCQSQQQSVDAWTTIAQAIRQGPTLPKIELVKFSGDPERQETPLKAA